VAGEVVEGMVVVAAGVVVLELQAVMTKTETNRIARGTNSFFILPPLYFIYHELTQTQSANFIEYPAWGGR
jgi:hypothetical protein